MPSIHGWHSFRCDLRRRVEDASDEATDPHERRLDVSLGQLEFPRELSERLSPMRRHGVQFGRPRMRLPAPEDQFAGLTKSDVVVCDHRFQQQQID